MNSAADKGYPSASNDSLDLVRFLQSFWRVRWGAITGSCLLASLTLLVIFSRGTSNTPVYSIVSIERTPTLGLSAEQIVSEFNMAANNPVVVGMLIDRLSQIDSGLTEAVRSAQNRTVDIGIPIFSLEATSVPDSFKLNINMPGTADRTVSLLQGLNDSLAAFTEKSRENTWKLLQDDFNQTQLELENSQNQLKENFRKLSIESAKIKLQLAEALIGVGINEAEQTRLMQASLERNQSASYYNLLIDAAYLQIERGLKSGRLTSAAASEYQQRLIELKLELDSVDSRLAVAKSMSDQTKFALQKAEKNLADLLGAKFQDLPKFVAAASGKPNVNAQSVSQTSRLLLPKVVLTILLAAIVGFVVGGFATAFGQFIRSNWSAITKSKAG